jgi:glycine/D-amino acid oxidase-like deaminating enzyme
MSTWKEAAKEKKYSSLSGDISADVIIVGGGMAGILNAYFLSRAGKSVVLLEKGEIGSGATMYTTAFITKVIDSPLHQIASIFGEEEAKTVWESGQKAVDEFERIIKEEKIECEFMRCSNYSFAGDNNEFKELKREAESYKRLGIEACLHESGDELGFENYGYLEVPDQAKFHPLKFLYSLAEKAVERGTKIFEGTEVSDLSLEGERIACAASGGKVTAESIIIATYKPLDNRRTRLKKAMYKSYIFEAEIPKGKLKEGIYEDNDNPYHYFRVDTGESHDRLIIGGEDHKDIFGDILDQKSFEGLEEYLREVMPAAGYRIKKRWTGPISEPSDGLALIGEIGKGAYVATGFSGNGMTYSMISAMSLSDLVIGRENRWSKAYSPSRTLLHPKRLGEKAVDYVEEFFRGAVKNLLQ